MDDDIFDVQCLNLLVVSIKSFLDCLEVRGEKKRKHWVRPIFMRRKMQGDYDNLVQELRGEPEMFHAYCRLTIEQYDHLLSLLEIHLRKNSHREPIPPGARLMLTLRYLSSGDLMKSMSFAYRMGASTVTNIIKETCDVIWMVLSPKYLKRLHEKDWKKTADGFYEKWDLPNCVGALDGKHVNIKAPSNSGSLFFNYKKTYSVVLMAVCDADLKFTNVDIGGYGGTSDGGILKNSIFGQLLNNRKLKLPPDSPLPGDTVHMPYYFVGDEAFPLNISLMRPYGGRGLSEEKKMFNYRLSRARRCIENAFGVLVAKWRIFHTPIETHVETADRIIKATVILHNYLIESESTSLTGRNTYITPNLIDQEDNFHNITEGDWRNSTYNGLQHHALSGCRMGSHNATRAALEVREYLTKYVCTLDVAPWQLSHIRRGIDPDETDNESESD